MAWLAPALALAVTAACGAQSRDHGTYATYNAGLATGYVPYAEERQPLVGPAVAGIESDVVCLQEVWQTDHVEDVLSATSAVFPHSHWVDTYDPEGNVGPPACTEDLTLPLLECVNTNCDGVPPDGLSDCVLTYCGAEFTALGYESPDCLNCLVANLGHTVEEIFETCHSESTIYLYDATNGVILLSRWELTDVDHVILDSTFNRRLALFARTTNDEGETVALVCTHLTPEFDAVPYTGDLGSWADEQAHQIGQIEEFVDSRVADGEMVVFMGDMNNGPAVDPDIDADLPENYALFGESGYLDPFTEGKDALCSYCAENPLNVDLDRNALIDHVFFRNFPSGTRYSGTRFLDLAITLETAEGPVDSRVSDHYGVAVRSFE
jgi:endonuclease/exonuclease/phosphatase family metal-dependent hydrolase